MLPRDERRRLEEIENQLSREDPDFVHQLTDPSARSLLTRLPPRVVLGCVAGVLAVLCLIFGEGAGFLMAAAVSAVLIALRNWDFRV